MEIVKHANCKYFLSSNRKCIKQTDSEASAGCRRWLPNRSRSRSSAKKKRRLAPPKKVNYYCVIMKYKQLTLVQRSEIKALRDQGLSQKKIADYIKVSQSTVSRELQRNGKPRSYITPNMRRDKPTTVSNGGIVLASTHLN